MKITRIILITLSFLFSFYACQEDALIKDFEQIEKEDNHQNKPKTCTTIEHEKFDSTISTGDVESRGTASTPQLWEVGQTLKVKFLGGSSYVRSKVMENAKLWEKYANIKFEQVHSGDADIRISFDTDDGSWSRIGTDAKWIRQSSPTMNFGWFSDLTSDEEFRRTTVHEFGHALGLRHEHKNPNNGIQWNKEVVYQYYKDCCDWSRSRVDHNIFNKLSTSHTAYCNYDSKSIMHYSIPSHLTLDGFSVGWNTDLSGEDKAFINRAYPFRGSRGDYCEEDHWSETPAYQLSHNQLTDWLYKGDINGDGQEELLRANGKTLEIYNPDFDRTSPVEAKTFDHDIQRVLIGYFHGAVRGSKQVAVVLKNGSMRVYAISDDKHKLWWWFTQNNFIRAEDHCQVGDFDGDGRDEILRHTPRTGQLKFHGIADGESTFFKEARNFEFGNLASLDLRDKKILIRKSGRNGNPDLFIVDYRHRQVFLYSTVRPNNDGRFTFWWAFTTNGHLFPKSASVYIANLDGRDDDDVLIRDNRTGEYSFFKAEYLDKKLKPINNIETGQLPDHLGTANLIALQRDANKKRDDIFFISEEDRYAKLAVAKQEGSRRTYHWAYTYNRIFR